MDNEVLKYYFIDCLKFASEIKLHLKSSFEMMKVHCWIRFKVPFMIVINKTIILQYFQPQGFSHSPQHDL